MKKVIGLAVLALAISACDDSDSSSSAASPSPTPTATPGTSPSPSPSPDPSATPTPTPTPTDYGEKGACLVPVSPTATTAVATGMGCLNCSVSEPGAVTTLNQDDAATMSAFLSLLPVGGQSDVSLRVNLALEQDPNVIPMTEEELDDEGNVVTPSVPLGPAPNTPGFVVSFPDPTIIAAGILPELLIETLKGDEVVENAAFGFGFGDGFALGSVLQEINNAEVYLPVQATQPYDAIRLSLTGTVLNLLIDVNVHDACINGVGGSISGDF